MQDNLGFIVFGISIVAILVVAVRQNLFQDIDDMMTSLRIGKHNVEYHLSPDRRMPLVIVDKEFGLRQLHPTFFNSFDKEDWQEFWDIIYGIHPLISFESEKLSAAKRNYSIAEIQKVLIKRYPGVFSTFNREHWKLFWKEIFGVLDSKLQISGGDEWMRKQRDKADRKLEKKMRRDDGKISSTIRGLRQEIEK
ncbi:MAG: hypothetical protein ISS47_00320 [Candidatus Omnitrophica bacterium]|nr:hypothetical protein [Candidatus Omnitrophota bacterium]